MTIESGSLATHGANQPARGIDSERINPTRLWINDPRNVPCDKPTRFQGADSWRRA